MKKLFVFAAAVIALAACSKTEVNTPDQAISFEVANYKAATKAEQSIGTTNTFKVNAYAHLDGVATAQNMMDDEVVAWNSDKKQWLPSRTYFWPKTGYINFFAYTDLGTTPKYPTTTDEGNITYTTVDIANDTDILVADAAYRYTGNANPTQYAKDDTGVTGVPILFHHVLAKVTFTVKVDATDAYNLIVPDGDKAKYTWEVVVDESKFGFANQGTTTFAFTDPSSKSHVAWNTYDTDKIKWTKTGDNSTSPQASTVIGDANKMTVSSAQVVSDKKTLFNEISVLPQDLSSGYAKFSIKYTIKSTYTDGTAKTITETVTQDLTDLLTYVPSITQWNMNTKYTYNIIIKPGEPIHFDPAVVEWETVTADDKII
jgi:hypothetical protein